MSCSNRLLLFTPQYKSSCRGKEKQEIQQREVQSRRENLIGNSSRSPQFFHLVYARCYETPIWWCHLYWWPFVLLVETSPKETVCSAQNFLVRELTALKGLPQFIYANILSTWFDYILVTLSFSLSCPSFLPPSPLSHYSFIWLDIYWIHSLFQNRKYGYCRAFCAHLHAACICASWANTKSSGVCLMASCTAPLRRGFLVKLEEAG